MVGAALAAALTVLTQTPESPAALMQALNAALLAGDSATLTLESWCARRRLADPARVVAVRAPGVAQPPPQAVRDRLQVSPDEPVAYRRVRLTCGGHVLSEADNWYVPARLSLSMNQTLDTTDTSFGRVILPLGPHRINLGVEWLWAGSGAPPASGEGLFRHRTLVEDAAGRPLAYVQETYLGAAVAPAL